MSVRCLNFNICYPQGAFCTVRTIWGSSTHEGLVYFENDEGGITVVDHTECREEVSIPEKINGLPVTRIAASAFRSCAKLKVATLPDSVREIEPHAFSYCNKLTTVNLSQDLKTIGAEAFYYCEKLSDVALPPLLETLGDHAFDLCFGLESIHIPASVKNWGRDVFARTSIDTVTFEDGLETIGEGAFYNTKLTSFCLPQSMKRIEAHAFGNCLLLSSVTLNEGLLSVGKDVFKYDSVLVEIVIPASVSEIYDLTFNCCTNLKRAKFEGDAPDGYVTSDPENAVVGNRYTVYYHADAEGFTAPEWNGYETEIW